MTLARKVAAALLASLVVAFFIALSSPAISAAPLPALSGPSLVLSQVDPPIPTPAPQGPTTTVTDPNLGADCNQDSWPDQSIVDHAMDTLLGQIGTGNGGWAHRSFQVGVSIFTFVAGFAWIWFLIKVARKATHPTEILASFAFKLLSFCTFLFLLYFAAGELPGQNGQSGALQIMQTFPGAVVNRIAPTNMTSALTPGALLTRGRCDAWRVFAMPYAAVIKSGSGWAPFDNFAGLMAALPVLGVSIIAALIVLATFVVLAVQMFVIQFSGILLAVFGIFILGFSGSPWTMPFASSYWKFVWTNCIQQVSILLVSAYATNLIAQVEHSIIAKLSDPAANANPIAAGLAGASSLLSFISIIVLMSFVMALAFITPKIAQSLLSGTPAMSFADVVGPASMAATGLAAGAVGGIAAGAAAAKAGGAAASFAKSAITGLQNRAATAATNKTAAAGGLPSAGMRNVTPQPAALPGGTPSASATSSGQKGASGTKSGQTQSAQSTTTSGQAESSGDPGQTRESATDGTADTDGPSHETGDDFSSTAQGLLDDLSASPSPTSPESLGRLANNATKLSNAATKASGTSKGSSPLQQAKQLAAKGVADAAKSVSSAAGALATSDTPNPAAAKAVTSAGAAVATAASTVASATTPAQATTALHAAAQAVAEQAKTLNGSGETAAQGDLRDAAVSLGLGAGYTAASGGSAPSNSASGAPGASHAHASSSGPSSGPSSATSGAPPSSPGSRSKSKPANAADAAAYEQYRKKNDAEQQLTPEQRLSKAAIKHARKHVNDILEKASKHSTGSGPGPSQSHIGYHLH